MGHIKLMLSAQEYTKHTLQSMSGFFYNYNLTILYCTKKAVKLIYIIHMCKCVIPAENSIHIHCFTKYFGYIMSLYLDTVGSKFSVELCIFFCCTKVWCIL